MIFRSPLTAVAAERSTLLADRAEVCFDRCRGGVDHLACTGDSSWNGFVATSEDGHELGRLGVS